VPNLEADVLTTDHAMLAMLRSRGSVTMEHMGWHTIRLVIGTSGSTPCWPGPHDHPRVLVEVPGGRWHAENEARAAGWQVVTCSRQTVAPCPALAGQPCHLAAGADVIVVSHPREEMWHGLRQSHASVHPGVPVYLDADADAVLFVERLAWLERPDRARSA